MMKWIRHSEPALVLAPMEGVTDYPMRRLLSEKMPFQFCVSEFLRVSHEIIPGRIFLREVPELNTDGLTLSGTPVQIQLLGGDAQLMAESAVIAVGLGAKAIDVNFGCPAPTVNRHDGGATLLKYPERIYTILSEIRTALPKHIPLSAKFRLGWENPADILVNAVQANKAGVDWITIHARTRMQGYAPPVQWEWIKKAKANLSIPVVANGDIWNLEQFLRCREQSGCEHFMLGRGALANPKLAFQIANELVIVHSKVPIPFQSRARDWVPLIEKFNEFSLETDGRPAYIPKRIKQWMNLATRCGDIPWFDQLKRMESVEEILRFLGSTDRCGETNPLY